MNILSKDNLFAFVLLCALAAGCRVGPNYAPVRASVPATWPAVNAPDSAARQTVDTKALAQWWTTLDDPVLSSLVERAVTNNKDLKIALTRIRQSRALLGVSEKQLDPSVNGSFRYQRSQSLIPTTEGTNQALYTRGSDYYNAGFDASWEIDLFGKLHRGIEAAAADLEASEEGYREVLVSLVAETASNYVTLRTLQKQLEIVERNLGLQEKALAVVEDQANVGLISFLQVRQQRYNIENTRSRLPGYRASIEASLNALAILLGEIPGNLHDELSAPGPIPVPGVEIAMGIPADILRRRPDIRQAERTLAAQTARVGVATADLYPSFSLSGFLGMTAASTSAFFSNTSPTANISPYISVPVFNRGKIRDQIEVQNAVEERDFIQYENTVLGAIKEVRDAVSAYGEEQKRYHMLEKGAEESRAAVDIADEQFRSGLVSYLSVIDAQRNLLSFEDSQTSSKGTITRDLIQLYKALGGGWDPDAKAQSAGNTKTQDR